MEGEVILDRGNLEKLTVDVDCHWCQHEIVDCPWCQQQMLETLYPNDDDDVWPLQRS